MRWPWQPKPMTAAAVTYVPSRNDRNPLRRRAWQDEAWHIWQNLGEAHYAVNFMARQLGRLRWDITENNEKLTEEQADEVIKYITQPEGTAEVTRQIGVNWLVPGEVFYVQIPDTETDTGMPGWKVVSPQHPDRKHILHDDVVAVHAWQPNPRRPQEPDSPMRAVLGVGNELLVLQSLSRAQTRSRLAQRGILLYPTGGFPEGTNFEDALEEAVNAPIIDEKAPSAVTPLMVSFDGTEIPNWRYINLESDYDENVQDKIDRAIRRLSLGLDLPPEILLGVAELNHWCVSDDTEAFTRNRGWVTQDQLQVGDEIRTLNHTTGLAEWQPVKDVYRADVVNEPMLHMESRTHTSLTTLNHRWPTVVSSGTRRWRTSETLGATDKITTGAVAADLPDEPKYTDSLVELVAWSSTDRHISNSGSLCLFQSHTRNPDRVASIRAALTSVFGEAVDTLCATDTPAWREKIQTNENAYGGAITVFYLNAEASSVVYEHMPNGYVDLGFIDTLTKAQLDLFIETTCQADGQHYRQGILDLWKKDINVIDPFVYAATLAGYATSIFEFEGGWVGRLQKTTSVRPIKAAEQSARTGTAGATAEVVEWTGTIWCPTTENSTWLARHGGKTFYTGNSAWQVEESTYRAHLEPLAFEIAYIFEQAIELTTGRIVEVTPDPRNLLARRQTVRDAFDALDRGIVNTSYVREVIGADDEDAPAQDAAVDTVLRMVRTAPTLAQSPGIPELTRQIKELVDTGEIIDEVDGQEIEGEGVREVGPPDEAVAAALPTGNGQSASDQEPELLDLADQLVRIDRELRARLYGAMETLYSLELAEDASVQQLTQVWAGSVEGGHSALNRLNIDTDSNSAEWEDAARSSVDLLAEGWRAYLQENNQRAEADALELPTELIRDVVAVAGGSERATVASANGHGPAPIVGASEPIPSAIDPRGFAIGKLALEALRNRGIRWEQWRWHYGPSLRAAPFVEHLILDGQFAGVMGEINGFYPGDHKGCLCDLVPVFRREVVR